MSTESNQAALAKRLKEKREYLGFSQEEVAKHLEIPRSAISLIETGVRRLAVLELTQLAKLYRCSIEDLTGDTKSQEPESVKMVARAVASLSSEDRSEVIRFVEFLRSNKTKNKK